ncbi:MAG: cadmium-translocating P-type ATPase [Chitinophagaceae bacterium]|nr:cadmium-translocating P-type ATPase [Chitinophagaceae bacterium]
MEKINWKVNGMSCANCSLAVAKYLEKEGMQNVKVNLVNGDVLFDNTVNTEPVKLAKGIEALGYSVQTDAKKPASSSKKLFRSHRERFLFCLVFTAPLMLHMFNKWLPIDWLMNPWTQLALCLPVYIVGMDFFGRSAIRSIRNGMPNMNVLIAIGATAAFVYSLAGSLLHLGHDYIFYETTATIITLVFLGNYLEDVSIQSTQKALNSLVKSQKTMANMIAFNEQHEEVILPVDNDQLRIGDLILIRSGDQVPADCKILSGTASVNESIITGESLPLEKNPKDALLGGSLLADGTVKAQVTATSKHSVLSTIIDLVKMAQGEKPPAQLLADKISAIFVPAVLILAALTFVINFFLLQQNQFTESLMRSIAVLVIACPCAMGLATPAAIAVGLGRAAKNGILFRNAKSLELFKNIRQAVFDKTGTLTTGDFTISAFQILSPDITEDEFQRIVYSLEKYSNHPIAQSISRNWKRNDGYRWQKTEEIKGLGMKAVTKEGDAYIAGSYKIAETQTADGSHNVYLTKNNILIGWLDLRDEIRPEAHNVIQYLKQKNIQPILLSGDRYAACKIVAEQLGIDTIIAEQTPTQKLEKLAELTRQAPTIMIGDGINDAPALAKATIGISLSEASQIAMQTADVVLTNKGLTNLPLSLGLGKHTFITIKQNLFWAFFYNIVAIPVAAIGLLTPTFAALAMGLSDVALGINSVRLFRKKVV